MSEAAADGVTETPSEATAETVAETASSEAGEAVAQTPPGGDAVAQTPSSEASVPTRAGLRNALLLFAAAIALCLLGYLAVSIPTSWFPSATPKEWSAGNLAIARGQGSLDKEHLWITATDATGAAIVSVPTDFNSTDYPVVAWVAIDLADNAEVSLLWRSDYAPSKLNAVKLSVVSGRLLPVSLAKNPAWVGRIKGLALLVQAPLQQPVRVYGVIVKPTGAFELLKDRFGEWLAFEGWSGTSINAVAGGADLQDLPLPTLLAVSALLAIGAWYGFARRRAVVAVLPAVIAMLFVLTWSVLDTRWMFNLVRQVNKTAWLYAGKDWHERSLAAEDGPLYAFIEKARAKMPATPARVFIVADAHYFRGRGAYHLYPHNVFFDPWQNTMPQPEMLRSGDFFIVYQKRGVEYDPKQQKLRWEGHTPIGAEALLVEPGAALLRIR